MTVQKPSIVRRLLYPSEVRYTPIHFKGDPDNITSKYGRNDQRPVVSYDEMIACMAIDARKLKENQRVSAGGIVINDNILLDFDYDDGYKPGEKMAYDYHGKQISYSSNKWLNEREAKELKSFNATAALDAALLRKKLTKPPPGGFFNGEKWKIQ